MSYSPDLSSGFNETRLRTPNHSSCSGMCSDCIQECPALCEIALSALRGTEAVYPSNPNGSQFASEKKYPVDFSDFNINGRVFGAHGLPEDSDIAHPLSVDLTCALGIMNPVMQKLPVILPAVAKLNWKDYYAGAAMGGVSAVIGEAVINKDSNVEFSNGKVTSSPLIKEMLSSFRAYERGYGDIVLQANYDDVSFGVLEYAIEKLNVKSVELKLGQAAKGIQAVSKKISFEEAKGLKVKGRLVYPNPDSEEIQKLVSSGYKPVFRVMGRLPMYKSEDLVSYIKGLRSMGAKRIMIKVGGYNRKDLELTLDIASQASVDLVTFDGAGGGTGDSPCKMMNEWGLPSIYLENIIWDILDKMKKSGRQLPGVAITGGFSLEDSIFKGLAFGAPYISFVGVCRAPMAAAMFSKMVGEGIENQEIPVSVRKFGSSAEEIYHDMQDLYILYGKDAKNFSPGSIGLFSYLNRIGFGLRLLMALNRKFSLGYIDRSDLIPLTTISKELLKDPWL
ncbi:MAG: FMN-binding glutamate synthase family protein [Synergistaceae bacterium]|nr:FMN-binding glutamate synthase family protein [Synergistaceae bacterium]